MTKRALEAGIGWAAASAFLGLYNSSPIGQREPRKKAIDPKKKAKRKAQRRARRITRQHG